MNILMILITSSLDYDERVRKEVYSLNKAGVNHVTIFASEEVASTRPIANTTIITPRFFISNRECIMVKLLKIAELYLRLKRNVSVPRYDKLWLHDPIMVFLIQLIAGRGKSSIIWDLHELPPAAFFNFRLLKYLFRKSAARCDTVIVANKERGDLMVSKGLITSYEVLNNYPLKDTASAADTDENNDYHDPEFDHFVKGKEFAYCQSATHPMRNFCSLARACVNSKQYLVVPGDKNEEFHRARASIPGFDEYILVLGKKPSNRLDYYLSKAKFSLVFYTNRNMNNFLCAPNRMFHSLKLGIPVIVGANPTMAKVVDSCGCGIRISTFGEVSEDIEYAIAVMNSNYQKYKKNAAASAHLFDWENQQEIIQKIALDKSEKTM